MELNGNSVPSAEASPNVASPTPPTTTAPAKPRYGSWMLVSRKEKPAPTGKNQRQNKKAEKTMANRGNQYSVLADIHDNGEPLTNRNSSEKDKSKSANNHRNNRANQTPVLDDNPVSDTSQTAHNSAAQGKPSSSSKQKTKGKAPTTSNSPQTQALTPQTAVPPVYSSPNLNPTARGREGRLSVTRGRGRGGGRGSVSGHAGHSLDPPSLGGRDQTTSQGIFHFGRAHPSADIRVDGDVLTSNHLRNQDNCLHRDSIDLLNVANSRSTN
nr:LINE-type retrotransposon LIb DNA [Ipomoea batatas]